MKKKEPSNQTQKTDQPAASQARGERLMKKRAPTLTQAETENSIAPHLNHEEAVNGQPDAIIVSLKEKIACRAYERFLVRGGHHGQDLADWIEAEREVMAESQCS